MSQTSEQDAPSTDSSPPPGRPFDSESAQEAAHEAWQTQRRKVLEEHGLWESWRCVPPEPEREKPLEEYLPGGSEYE
ncbi:hypothetical protein M197_gp73 [Haloarcula hispanica tailed virus 2]|uniref:Uncharacterized protein n=1 Tax=Haloarcula hispanica tailed virus 2 TaxID=1273751 RepID=R4TKN6_9CAUD|nr:hypothetical protein M197_gp73 [Haloarcula hispanica tailed virus 2]AGM11237.1 hypothetical protein HHTV2_73 [Haloarcula hispanica tailed virus 2]